MKYNIHQGNNSRAGGRDFIENLTIYNGIYPIKLLKNYDGEIAVQKISFTRQDKMTLFVILFSIFIIIISAILFPYFIVIMEDGTKIINIIDFLISTFMLLIICFAFYMLIYISIDYKNTSKLRLKNNQLSLIFKENVSKEIKYKDIRFFRLEKNILGFGTNFFIYKINEIEPYLSFRIVSVHAVIAVEELLNYIRSKEIDELIKKENDKSQNQNN